MNEEIKINKKKLTIELTIALAMIIFIVVAMIIQDSREKAENEIADSALNHSVSINNDDLYNNTPPVPSAEYINSLNESELKAALSENSMIKLETESGIVVYVNNYRDSERFKSAVSFNESEIEKIIYSEILSGYSTEEEANHDVAAKNDIVSINYAGSIDGTPFEGGSEDGALLTIGEGHYLEEFENGLIGMKVGETKDVPVTFPENYGATDLAGKKAIFKITLNEITGTKIYPEKLTDEIANEVSGGRYQTAEDLRQYYKDQYIGKLVDHFIQGTACVSDIPEEDTIKIYDQQLNYYATQAENQGTNVATLLSFYGRTVDQLKHELMENAANEVRLGLLYEAMAKDLDITLEDNDYVTLAKNNGYEDPEAFYDSIGIDKDYAGKFILRDKVNKKLFSMAQ
jgi:trigger factor